MGISTHILDTTRGLPASGVDVMLERLTSEGWSAVGRGTTDADGRVSALLSDTPGAGTYRITFHVTPYFAALGVASFYPEVMISFIVRAHPSGTPDGGSPNPSEPGAREHYHVPLLLNPFGFTTYRGS